MTNIKRYLKNDSSFKNYLAILKTKENRLHLNFFYHFSVCNLVKVNMYSDLTVKGGSLYMDFSYYLSVLTFAQYLFRN